MPPAARGSALLSRTADSPSCWPPCGSSATGTSFGATGFGTFGAFWIGLGFWILLVVNPAVAAIKPATAAATVTSINHDLGWILLGFAIFTTYVMILATQTNTALFVTSSSCGSP